VAASGSAGINAIAASPVHTRKPGRIGPV